MTKRKVIKKLSKSQNKKPQLEVENRLTREEQIKVIQWLVELKSQRQIVSLIDDEFHKEITQPAIWKYAHSKKWKPIINRLKERFEKNIAKIPIANKSHRIRILQKVVDEGLTWSLKNITKDGDEIYELKLSAVTDALREAREELEGNKMAIGIQNITIVYPNWKGNGDKNIRATRETASIS